MEIKDVILFILAVAVFFGVTYIIYDYAISNLAEEHGEEHQLSEAEEIYMKHLERELNLENYQYIYEEKKNYIPSTVTVVKNGDEAYVSYENYIASEETYFIGNDIYFCVDFEKTKKCTKVDENSSFYEYTNVILRKEIITEEMLEADKEASGILLEKGAMEFSEEITEKEINGHSCSEISYTIDFGKLTVEDLNRFGLDANSAKVYTDYKITLCIGEDGEAYEKTFSFEMIGNPVESAKTLVEKDNNVHEIEKPTHLSNESEVEDLFDLSLGTQDEIAFCFDQDEPEMCIKSVAVNRENPDLCNYAGPNKESCLFIITIQADDPEGCSGLTVDAFKNECYFEFAMRNKNETLCTFISDEETKNNCTESVQNLAE
ncbi:hypothetical protein JXB01_02620 [Candidatus Micrarchaeota archaeon]|nr:hypothetical protein [Candidatus Micrarchaeota archaeon]